FAKAFDITFQSQEGSLEHAWTTSWGVSTRLIGALVMTHSDNDGLILPPRVSPVQVIIMPICTDEKRRDEEMLPLAKHVADMLNKILGPRMAMVDTQFHMRPGDRFFLHLQKGVPLRLELGERELEEKSFRFVRRDNGEKGFISLENLTAEVPRILDDIQRQLYTRALDFRKKHTSRASSLEEMKAILSEQGGFVEAFFGGSPEDEKVIKEVTGGATVRCFPLANKEERGNCVFTGKENASLAVFAKSY
ncbi:MAG TPA: His/Gly/Thr/Pro-type tRNA ligase C-terminal domain-containing protein, partial [Synergistaceae bacterium]|nr:His/Gly/Thr/Pro-type tRNA ligase C-terminal domain-containing protein [Synergistaceae bacterium]